MSDQLKSRAGGVLLACLGLAGTVGLHWKLLGTDRVFPFKLAVLCPTVVFMGVWLMIEAPTLPPKKSTPLAWFFLALGLVAGFLNVEFLRSGKILFWN